MMHTSSGCELAHTQFNLQFCIKRKNGERKEGLDSLKRPTILWLLPPSQTVHKSVI